MVQLLKNVGSFFEWIPIIITELRKNTNLERYIRDVLWKFGFENIRSKIVEVMIYPSGKTQSGMYGLMYEFRSVIKFLGEENGETKPIYKYISCYAMNKDINKKLYQEKTIDLFGMYENEDKLY